MPDPCMLTIPELDVAERPRRTLRPSDLGPLTFSRLLDHEVAELAPWLQPVQVGRRFRITLSLRQPRLFLPKVFIGAQLAFGRSSQLHDPTKVSFRFPLLVTGMRNEKPVRYVAVLADVCGYVGVGFSRIRTHGNDGTEDGEAEPSEDPLNEEEIEALGYRLLGYVEGMGSAATSMTPCFYRTVRDQFVVYGCRRGELFEREVEDEEAYEQLIATIEADLGSEQTREQQRAMTMLEAVAQTTRVAR